MKPYLFCIAVLATLSAAGQQKVIKTVKLADTVLYTAVDRPGDFYIVTKNGQTQKFDKNGKLQIVHQHRETPTLFDPRDGARLFAYYRARQQYDYYNPSFEVTASHTVDPAFAIRPWLICPSGDHKLWVLDSADHSLKKLNAQHTEVEIEVVVDSTLIGDASAFTTLREYQGFVFLLDPRRGIYIFNSLGRHIKTIAESGIGGFNFLGEELYFLKQGQVRFLNLFTAEGRSLPLQKPAHMVVLTDERMVLIGYTSFEVLEFIP